MFADIVSMHGEDDAPLSGKLRWPTTQQRESTAICAQSTRADDAVVSLLLVGCHMRPKKSLLIALRPSLCGKASVYQPWPLHWFTREVPARIALTPYVTERCSSLLKNPAVKRCAIGDCRAPQLSRKAYQAKCLLQSVDMKNHIERYDQLYAVKICK